MRDSHFAINLVGILAESGAQTFEAVQGQGAGAVARAASAIGARMVHVSAIGADENSPSDYARAKAAAKRRCWRPRRRPPSCGLRGVRP